MRHPTKWIKLKILGFTVWFSHTLKIEHAINIWNGQFLFILERSLLNNLDFVLCDYSFVYDFGTLDMSD